MVKNSFKLIRCVLTICVLFSVCMLKNFILGIILLMVMCIFEALEYRKTKKRKWIILDLALFFICSVITFLYEI